MKKDGGVRLVQDFRALNNQSYTDKYSMKDVSECIGEIGRSGSTIFSTIDLTAGFWQMILHPRARPYTAFTVPGMGQFQWVTSPMGLLGCPASFQRLMETVVNGLANVIVYIDDLLVHSATHPEHIAALDQVLQRLVQHNIKINLQKCFFGSKVFYRAPINLKRSKTRRPPQTYTKSVNFWAYATSSAVTSGISPRSPLPSQPSPRKNALGRAVHYHLKLSPLFKSYRRTSVLNLWWIIPEETALTPSLRMQA
jgi:hypothetical protein